MLVASSCAPIDGELPPAREVDPVSARDQAFTSRGIERVIPVRFIDVMPPSAPSVPLVDVQHAIQRANDAFKTAGVQFTLRSYDAYFMPTIAANMGPNMLIPWSSVAAEIQLVFPAASYSGEQQTAAEWINKTTFRNSDKSSIYVWIFSTGINGPYAGEVVVHSTIGMSPGFFGAGNPHFLAHELGHHLGLPHTWQFAFRNPETAAPCVPADFWDLAYRPGAGGAGGGTGHRYFASRADAVDAGATVAMIDRCGEQGECSKLDAGPPSCTVTTATGADAGQLNCPDIRPAGAAYAEAKTYASPELRRGHSFTSDPNTVAGAIGWGANVMSYFSNGIDSANGLSDSQVLQVRRTLRFDQWNTTYDAPGRRPFHGDYANRQPADKLDFNNDGKRELAVWQPPTGTSGTGTFIIRFGPSYPSGAGELQVSFGDLGDVPVPADYDGDGITDLAVFRPGVTAAGTVGSGASSDQSSWSLCLSGGVAWSPSTPANKCSAPVKVNFGIREDVPYPGLSFDGLTSTGELAVYRPSTKTWYWAVGQAWPATPPWPSGSSPGWQGGVQTGDSEPGVFLALPGLYDSDDKTDLVAYNPASATFTLLFSTNAWAFPFTRAFDASFIPSGTGTSAQRAGAVPVTGMYSLQSGKQRLALALWDPDSGNWSVNWTPATSATPQTPCQWGTRGDVPVGMVGTNFDQTTGTNYSSFTVFRSADVSLDGKPWLYMKAANGSTCGGAVTSADQSLAGLGTSFGRSHTQVFSLPRMSTNGSVSVIEIEGLNGNVFKFRNNCSPWAPYTCGDSYSLGDQHAMFL